MAKKKPLTEKQEMIHGLIEFIFVLIIQGLLVGIRYVMFPTLPLWVFFLPSYFVGAIILFVTIKICLEHR